jgi:CubicO group peptidase (beta-lactamase class C family)
MKTKHCTTRALLLYFLVTSFCILFASLSQAETAAKDDLQTLKQDIENIRVSTGVPGMAIALVDKNGAIWVDGLGVANREASTPATPETLFRIGSVSKMFAGIAVMQLVEQDKLSLDDKLDDHLPDLVYENPWKETHPLRVAHLLEHTTGWDVHTGEYVVDVNDKISLKDGLNLHTDARVSRWAPGTRQTYSNTGPVVAAQIVEEISGMDFEDYAQQNIFGPLDMTNSSFLKGAAFDKLGATGYSMAGPVDYYHIYTRPSSTLSASAHGIANVLEMLVNRGQFHGQIFLQAATLDRMEKPQTTLGDQAGIHSGYGVTIDAFGFENRNTVFYGHTGGVPGFASEVIYQPELGLGYAFIINQDNPQAFHQLSNRLRSYLLKDAAPKVVKTAELPQAFKNMDGYYTPINPLLDLGSIVNDISGVMHIMSDDKLLHRSPFFGGWKSNYYSLEGGDSNALYSDWTGLPSIVWVEDPVAGRALQVEGVLYQKAPVALVYGRLIALALSLFLIVTSLFYGLVKLMVILVKSFRSTSNKTGNFLSLYPVLLSVLLVSIPAYLVVSQVDVNLVFLSLAFVVAVYVCGLLYMIGALGGWYLVYKNKSSTSIYTKVLLAAHSFVVIYLLSYGLLPLNLWA